jgi:serine/threonine protein kinase
MKTCPTCQGSYPNNYAVCPQDGSALEDVGIWTEGSVIRGKYRILSKVGQGGMGAVYKALHLAFDELRALKVIVPEILHDQLFVRRFRQEAVITRKLQHPNAVRVDDIDEAEDGRPFIVMEFIQGKSLKKLIEEEGPLRVPRVCSIIKQVASALDAAHRLGMVHRDIKPDNIALIERPEGELVKVLDFGIAKMKEARVGEASGMTLTGTGMVIGTPQYISPEQAMGKRGDELDGRSDLYSLGVVMYEMLTAALPFKAETTMEMLLAHLQQPPRPIPTLRPELQIPEPIVRLAMRLLEKDPAQRPASAKALIEEVEAAEKGNAPSGARWAKQPTEVTSREEIRAAPEAVRPVPEKGQAALVSTLVPASPPPVQPQVVTPRTPVPVVLPTPQPEKQSHWGIWVGIAILLVGLGGGGWYILSRHSSSLSTTPVSTTSGQGEGAPQQTSSQPPAHEQNPPVPESPEGKTSVGQGIQPEAARTASETPKSSVNIAPTGTAASAVAKPHAPPKSSGPPILLIEATPGDAHVYIDDETVGITSPEGRLKITTLSSGAHRVRLAHRSFRDHEETVRLISGETARVATNLQAAAVTPVEIPAEPTGTITNPTATVSVAPGYLGVRAVEHQPAGSRGVVILDTAPGGPADRAGLKPNDTILSIGGQRIRTPQDLQAAMASHKAGETVEVTWSSGSSVVTKSIRLSARVAGPHR